MRQEKRPRCWSPGGRQQPLGGGSMDQSMRWSCRGQRTWWGRKGHFRQLRRIRKCKTPGGGAPSGDIREETPVTNRPVTPPVERNSPLVSTPPPPVTTPPPPARTPPSLERGQHTRQPPAYLKDFVCDCVTSGKYESPTRCRTGKLATKCSSCEHHENINFCPGGITNEIHPPETKSPSHVS